MREESGRDEKERGKEGRMREKEEGRDGEGRGRNE